MLSTGSSILHSKYGTGLLFLLIDRADGTYHQRYTKLCTCRDDQYKVCWGGRQLTPRAGNT